MRSAEPTVTLSYLGEDVPVTYRLGEIDSNLEDFMQEHGSEPGSLRDMIERIVVEWDVLDAEGERIPATAAAMREHRLPTPFLIAVIAEISGNASPKQKPRATSAGGSRRRAG